MNRENEKEKIEKIVEDNKEKIENHLNKNEKKIFDRLQKIVSEWCQKGVNASSVLAKYVMALPNFFKLLYRLYNDPEYPKIKKGKILIALCFLALLGVSYIPVTIIAFTLPGTLYIEHGTAIALVGWALSSSINDDDCKIIIKRNWKEINGDGDILEIIQGILSIFNIGKDSIIDKAFEKLNPFKYFKKINWFKWFK